MKIKELFVKPVDRAIEGVIKADDERNLQTEVEEYVVTAEISKGLSELTERYLEETNANGVWISGFFGSGKSHLLKILSLVLDNRELPSGVHASDLLLPKIEDEILRGDLQRAIKIPSHSILFNIDQKSDAIGGDPESRVLEVFVKVLNELQGYYSKQGHIAQFEFDLDSRGELEGFKEAWANETGRTWEEDRPVVETLENETFAKVYSDHFGKDYEEGLKLFDRQRAAYKVSPEDFAQRVKAYIDSQGADFRLNFFADEVGQYIGDDSKLMLNLQTITESLATICEGRAWVFVTSQGELKSVLGDLKRDEGDDFTKIQARFKSRVTLTSADVREVIQKRLLAKHEDEPEVLANIYDVEKENLNTLFRFGEGSMEYKSWRGSDEFCAFYPFSPYQFDLFQSAIEQLSRHDAFTGKHTAVGERSMLAVFQEVAKKIQNEEVGHLATFDLMYEGIAASLRGDIQTSVRRAERQLDDPVAVKIIKALFLLKWVNEFKPTPRNIAILLIDHPDIDIQAYEKDVREALNILESQSYLQRNGDRYEFLTDKEKDIEVEIKNTDIDESELTKVLTEILFQDILRDPKIHYQENGQDYPYARKLDDQLVGRDADIAINLVTSDHPNHDDLYALAAQNTGKAELLGVLMDDDKAIEDSRLYLKTNKYIQQNTSGNLDETRKEILRQRGLQNSDRRSAIQEQCSERMGKAPLYLNGSELTAIGEGDTRNRFAKASQELISFAFPKLRMMKGSYDEHLLEKTLLEQDDLLTGGSTTLSEAEEEVLTHIIRNQGKGERTSIDEIVREFQKRPYGWPLMAILTITARLFRMGKIELRMSDLLDSRSALAALKNTRQHGSIWVRLQEQFDERKVLALKRFHQDFFDRENEGNDPRTVAQITSEALTTEEKGIQLLLDQAQRYPFLSQLGPICERIKDLSEKDYAYLLNNLSDFEETLLVEKEDVLAPIKVFMHGAQRETYDEVLKFFNEEQANFSDVTDEDLEPLTKLIESEAPFRGSVLPDAKAATNKLRTLIEEKLLEAQQEATNNIIEYEKKIKEMPEFKGLDDSQRVEVFQKSQDMVESISSSRFISAVRDLINRYTSNVYPAQLALVSSLAADKDKKGVSKVKQPVFVPASSLKPEFDLAFLATEDDVDRWLQALREAALFELKNGKRLSL